MREIRQVRDSSRNGSGESFAAMESWRSSVRLPSDVGMLPLSSLTVRCSLLRFSRLPSWLGILPPELVIAQVDDLKTAQVSKLMGYRAVSSLLNSMRVLRFDRSPSSAGMDPESSFLARYSPSSW